MSKNPKVKIDVTPVEKMTEQQKQDFLNGKPSRSEVMQFINSYLSTEILPKILDYVNKRDNYAIALFSVCQSILISQGVISEGDFKNVLEENLKNLAEIKETPDETPKDETPQGVIK